MVSKTYEANFDHTVTALMDRLGTTVVELEVAGIALVFAKRRRLRAPRLAVLMLGSAMGVVMVLMVPGSLIGSLI